MAELKKLILSHLKQGGRGQGAFDQITAGVIGIVALIALVAFATPLLSNFYTSTGYTPPFSTTWQMVAMGVTLIIFIVGGFTLLRRG